MFILLRYWKAVVIAVIISCIAYIGYHYHTLQDQAHEVVQLQAQIKYMNTELVKSQKLEAQYEKKLNNLRQHNEKTVENAQKDINAHKDYNTCRNSDFMFGLLQHNASGK